MICIDETALKRNSSRIFEYNLPIHLRYNVIYIYYIHINISKIKISKWKYSSNWTKKKRKMFLTWFTVDTGDFDVVVLWSSRSAAVEWYNIIIPVEVRPIAFTHALIYRVSWHQGRPKSVAVLRASPVAGAAHTDASTVCRGC